jgi:hypothetical protein
VLVFAGFLVAAQGVGGVPEPLFEGLGGLLLLGGGSRHGWFLPTPDV